MNIVSILRKARIFRVVGIFGVLLLMHTQVSAQQTLKLAALDNYAPFSWSENGQGKGSDVEIVNELCLRLNIRCTVIFLPWKRALVETEYGRIDGIIGAFTSLKRNEFAYSVPFPLHYSIVKVFVRNEDAQDYKKVEDLQGKSVGINRGFHLSKQIDDAVESGFFDMQVANNSEANISKLLQGRIEGFLGNYHQTTWLLEKLSLTEKVRDIPAFVKIPIPAHIIISKKSPIKDKIDLLLRLDRTLQSIYREPYFKKFMVAPK